MTRTISPRPMRQSAPYKSVLALLVAIQLAGCGYKAPLFLPKPKPEGRKPAAVVLPEPAPSRPVPSEAAPDPK